MIFLKDKLLCTCIDKAYSGCYKIMSAAQTIFRLDYMCLWCRTHDSVWHRCDTDTLRWYVTDTYS